MRQQRVLKRRQPTDKRGQSRQDEQEKRPEIRQDLRHWFEER